MFITVSTLYVSVDLGGCNLAFFSAFNSSQSFTYSAIGFRSPFEPEVDSIDDELEQDNSTESVSGITPDFNRHKEALESYPIDALRFVGSLEKDNQLWGIVISPDGLVHKVQANNYLGQNYGKVTAVSEDRIELIELIKDIRQGWIEREAALTLIE